MMTIIYNGIICNDDGGPDDDDDDDDDFSDRVRIAQCI